MIEASTIAAPFIRDMLEGVELQGFSKVDLLMQAGISTEILSHDRYRISFAQLAKLSDIIVDLLDDELYGLASSPLRKHSFKYMCYAAIHGDTVYEVLRAFADVSALMSGPFNNRITLTDDYCHVDLLLKEGESIVNPHAIVHTMCSMHRTFCWIVNSRVPAVRVDLAFPEPEYKEEYKYVFLDAPVYFSQSNCRFTFHRKDVEHTNVRNIYQLKEFLKNAPLIFLTSGFETNDLTTKIRVWLDKYIQRYGDAPDIDAAAQHFSQHPQAMRRQLKKEGTNFQTIKMETRRDLAIQMISRESLSIEEIANKLGFSEPSPFIRAFKSWTGLTPLAYKKLEQSNLELESENLENLADL